MITALLDTREKLKCFPLNTTVESLLSEILERGIIMRRMLCVLLSICMLMMMTPTALAVENNDEPILREVYEFDGYSLYYEHNNNYTINAILREAYVEYCMADHVTGQLFCKHIPIDGATALLLAEEDVVAWETVCDQAEESVLVMYEETNIVDTELVINPPVVAGVQNTYADLVELMEEEFGSQLHPYRFYDSAVSDGILVSVYESCEYDIIFQDRLDNNVNRTLQACATLIGCKASLLGAFLSLAIDEIVPAGTSILYYVCYFIESRQGRIGGTGYYTVEHQIAYPAFDNANVSNSTEILFDEPIYDIYTDNQSVYESVSKIAEKTVYIYNRSN